MKSKESEIYTIAYLTSAFVGCVLNGKEIPSFENVFHSTEQTEVDEATRVAFMREQLLEFATQANKRRQKQ